MAGQRIKWQTAVPQNAGEGLSPTANSSAAGANAWLEMFEDTMLAAGFVRTSDTDQLDQVTTTISNRNIIGYRTYSLQDEYSNIDPWIFRVEFAGRPIESSYHRIRAVNVILGKETDGAGNLVGDSAYVTRRDDAYQTHIPTGAWLGGLGAFAWRKDHLTLVCVQPDSRRVVPSSGEIVTGGEVFFGIGRARDLEGNVILGQVYGVGADPVNGPTASGYRAVVTPMTLSWPSPDKILSRMPLPILGSPTMREDGSVEALPILLGGHPNSGLYPLSGVLAYNSREWLPSGGEITVNNSPYKVLGGLGHIVNLQALLDSRRMGSGVSALSVSVTDLLGVNMVRAIHTGPGFLLDWSD